MANTTRHTPKDGESVTFQPAEIRTLRTILNDWVNEELMIPPYPAELMALLEKVGVRTPVPEDRRSRAPQRGPKGTEPIPAAPDDGGPGGRPQLRPNLG